MIGTLVGPLPFNAVGALVKDGTAGTLGDALPVVIGAPVDALGNDGAGVPTLAVVGTGDPTIAIGENEKTGRTRVGNRVKDGPFCVVGKTVLDKGDSVSRVGVGTGADGPCVSDCTGDDVRGEVEYGPGEGLGRGRGFDV